jgi:hypothetical protein
MKLTNYLAGSKRFVLITLARISLRIADRLLRFSFRGFRAGYLPLGILRATSRTAGRLQRLSLRVWTASTGRPRLPDESSEARKPLPESLTQLLQQPVSGEAKSHAPRRPVPARSDMHLRRF